MNSQLTIPLFDFKIRVIPTGLIVLAVVVTALLGGLATDTASDWYRNLRLPAEQPPARVFGPVWTVLYILLAFSAILAFHKARQPVERNRLMMFYGVNGILNIGWSLIFFRAHAPVVAGVEIVILWLSILLIMIRTWPASRMASLLLLPYLLWVGFATLLTWKIALMN